MKTYNDLTGLYSLKKTLRFELKPIGKTLENLESKGLINQDEVRAEEYEKVKAIIDEYHKEFIKLCLSDFKLKLHSDGGTDSLDDYVSLASTTRNETEEKEFVKVKDNLRKQIVSAFKKRDSYSDLFKQELILNRLPNFVTDDEQRQMIKNFSGFTTYFYVFQENRKNMYSDEDKSSAIAYRLIHENLPMFLDNMKSFAKIAESEVAEHFADIEAAFTEYLNVEHICDMFRLDYFSDTLTQEQIAVYNNIIGGRTKEDGTKIQGINEYVNLFNQQHHDERLPLLKPLYKMILSDRVAISWLPEEFSSDEDMLQAINDTHDMLKGPLIALRELLMHLADYDTNHIYIANDLGLTDISKQIFGQYDVYTNGIKERLRTSVTPTAKERREPELLNERINKIFKTAKSFSISDLNSFTEKSKTIESYFSKLGAYDRDGDQRINLFNQLDIAHIAATEVLAGTHSNLNQSETDIKLLKDLLDSYKALQHFIKPLLGNGDEAEKDNEFDAQLRAVWNKLDIITPLYNKVRNWLTRKPYSIEKIKLNFENNGKLLDGWVDSKTEKSDNGTQYGGYIFRKKNEIGEYDFFLGISTDTKLFRRDNNIQINDNLYERLDYYQVKSKTIFGSSYDGNYKQETEQLLATIKNSVKQMQLTSDFLPSEKEKAPTYLKRIKSLDYSVFERLINNEDVCEKYNSIKEKTLQALASLYRVNAAVQLSKRTDLTFDELFDAIEKLPSISFSYYPIDSQSLINATEREKRTLFLFKITNKDLSFAETSTQGLRKNRGTDNLHTMYLKALLSMEQGIYDLGTGKVFFRKASIKNTHPTHLANQPIKNKNVANAKSQSVFKYDLIKNKRYTCNKFQFHISININYSKDKSYNVSSATKEIIRNNGIKHIIGIDRGERHLLYLSLIDLKGNIIKQMSLNDIINEYNSKSYTTNYKNLLAAREGDRTEARRNWQKIENIKELKEGYLSQVVHIIAKMMVEYKAIVVLEDLNMGFMRGRQKIERNVYEQFEKKLIDKLNYYVDKQKSATEVGGLLHALQLTNKFESFKKLKKQSGCLFYVPAWNTSKIDPVTGFVNMLDTRYENVDKTRCFFSKFDSIIYNSEKDWFEFTFDYNKFGNRAEGTQTRWTLCSYGTRIRTFRNPAINNNWDNEEVNLTNEFKKIFANADISISDNLKESICNLTEKRVLESLMHLMKLLVQMRNSMTNSEVDYLLSPVADEQGNFYDSRTCDNSLPKDADANGAYNIARKGLWAVQKIKEIKDDKINLAISNKEWLQFAQQKPYLND